MKMRKLGKGGLEVSEMGLGCMGMTAFYGDRDDAESTKTLERALELGVNFLDTADVYGPHTNEELVGRFVQEHRDQVVLASKFGFVGAGPGGRSSVNGKPEYVRSACEASLRRLGIKTIDLYYLHRVDPTTPIEKTVDAMADLVSEGKVRHLGLSEVSAATLRRAHAVHPITAVQSEYSLWSRDPEAGVLAACRELGVGFVAYSPLGRGFLAGRFRGPADIPTDDTRRNHPRFQELNFAKNLEMLKEVETLASEKRITAAQLALAWVLQRGEDIVPIPGTKKRKYLEENVGAVNVHLTQSDLDRIDRFARVGAAAGERYPEGSLALLDR